MRGVELSHHNGDCSFETILHRYELDRCSFKLLIDRYNLDNDPALMRLARIVHAADIDEDVETADHHLLTRACLVRLRRPRQRRP